MTQDELREAVLAALLDYETLKKTRRLKAVKKALRGTVMATVIGGAGITAAKEVRSNQVQETATIVASKPNAMPAMARLSEETSYSKLIPGVALFAFDRHTLAAEQEAKLTELIKQLPRDSEITVIGLTDSQGGQRYNKKLGRQRAQTVADHLTRHGMKIKAIGSNISNDIPNAWMARRVDIIVDSASGPFYLKLTSLENQRPFQQSQPQTQTPLNTFNYRDKVKKDLPETENRPTIGSAENAGTKPDADAATAKPKPEQKAFQRQQVRGVTHYAFNSYNLAVAHKERLMEFIKQLSKDAELTVVGRTDADEHNKNLGMQRAKTVAIFLANHGLKVNAVASKVSSDRFTGWFARRVDIVVDSRLTPQAINQPPSVVKGHNQQAKASPETQSGSITYADGKRAAAIEQDVTHLIQQARYRFNDN